LKRWSLRLFEDGRQNNNKKKKKKKSNNNNNNNKMSSYKRLVPDLKMVQ